MKDIDVKIKDFALIECFLDEIKKIKEAIEIHDQNEAMYLIGRTQIYFECKLREMIE